MSNDSYATASCHVADERDRLVVRLRRLAIERRGIDPRDEHLVAYLRDREAALRSTIEARLAATREAGSPVPLDQIVSRLDLSHVERCVLIVLVVLTLLGPDGRQLLREVEGSRHGGRLTVGVLFLLLGLDLDGRADLIERLRPNRELIRSRLVTLGWEPETSADIVESTIALQHDALAALMDRAPITKIILEG